MAPRFYIVAAPLGYYAVIDGYWQSRRDTVQEARADMARAIDLMNHSSTPLVWLAI